MKLRVALLFALLLALVPLVGATVAPVGAAPREPATEQSGEASAPDRTERRLAADHEHPPGTPAHDHGAAADDGRAATNFFQADPTADPAVASQDRAEKARRDPCAKKGLKKDPNTELCTHGPDLTPPGFSVAKDVAPAPAAAATETPRANCVGNGTDGARVQVLYARASDVASRYQQFLPSFRVWADDANLIFQQSAAETGGNRAIR